MKNTQTPSQFSEDCQVKGHCHLFMLFSLNRDSSIPFPYTYMQKKKKVVARLIFFIDKETRFTRNTLLETQHWITTKECKSRSRAKYRFLDASQWYFVHEIQWYAVIKTCNQDSDDDKFLFYLWRMAFQDVVFIMLKITNNHPNCTSMEALDAFLPSFHSDRR